VLLGVGVNSLPDIQCRGHRSSIPLPIHFRPMGPPPPRAPPTKAVNQFRPATFQLPRGTPGELRRLAHHSAPDLIDQPSLPNLLWNHRLPRTARTPVTSPETS
jgi:hypothetical protein